MLRLTKRCLMGPSLVAVLLLGGIVGTAAGGTLDNTKIALHLKAATSNHLTACTSWAPVDVPCSQFQTRGQVGVRYYAYLVAADAGGNAWNDPGLAGISCGIQYDPAQGSGVDVFDWTLCADLEFTNSPIPGDIANEWPASGGGNRMTWIMTSNCQKDVIAGYESEGVHVIAGAFYLYAYGEDLFYIQPNMNVPGGNELAVANCTGAMSWLPLDRRGALQFTSAGDTDGYNPCTGAGTPPPNPPEPPPPPPPADPTVLLHVGPVVAQRVACASAPSTPEDVVTVGEANPDGSALYFVYLLATPGNNLVDPIGLSGVQVGIDYTESPLPTEGLKVFGWSSCAGTEFVGDNWPASGTGNTIVWGKADCDPGPIAVVGYFYVGAYSPSSMSIVGWPGTGLVKTADCLGAEAVFDDTLSVAQVGWVSLGGAMKGRDDDGCNPALEVCNDQSVSVQQTTWGKLKTRFR